MKYSLFNLKIYLIIYLAFKIWVQSSHSSNGYFNIYGDDQNDHFNCRLATGDTTSSYARTGFLGFVRRTDPEMQNTEPHDAIYIVGSLDETLMIRGMRYHPIDIEATVLRSHKKICEWFDNFQIEHFNLRLN